MSATRADPGITPWYRANETAEHLHRVQLAYERAVRERVGVATARTAVLTAMRAFEASAS